MALRAVIEHPKFTRLKVLLGLNKSCTLGYLEGLWHFTGRYTPNGHIGKYEVEEIEAWLEWNGEDGRLIEAMVKSRWIDLDPVHGLIVHDWNKHADDATKLALKRSNCSFVVPTCSDNCPDTVATPSRLPEPEPEPEPEPDRASPFVKPSPMQVCEYMTDRGFPDPSLNSEAFMAFYNGNGWMAGRNKMKDWKACVATWETRMKSDGRWDAKPKKTKELYHD